MNYEDQVTKEYIEAALANAGPKIVAGTYDGDGSASRFIDLGFTPKAVLVVDKYGRMNAENTLATVQYWYGGLAVSGNPTVSVDNFVLVEITDGGFSVHSGAKSNYYYYRANTGLHYYIAIG